MEEMIQISINAIVIFLSVTMFRWRDANSIAINFSKVTNFR